MLATTKIHTLNYLISACNYIKVLPIQDVQLPKDILNNRYRKDSMSEAEFDGVDGFKVNSRQTVENPLHKKKFCSIFLKVTKCSVQSYRKLQKVFQKCIFALFCELVL